MSTKEYNSSNQIKNQYINKFIYIHIKITYQKKKKKKKRRNYLKNLSDWVFNQVKFSLYFVTVVDTYIYIYIYKYRKKERDINLIMLMIYFMIQMQTDIYIFKYINLI